MRTITIALSVVFIFIIPWEGAVDFPGLGAGDSTTMAKYIGLVLGAFWVATIVVTGRFRAPTAFHLMVYLFVAWNAASIFWSRGTARTVAHVVTWFQLLVLVFILWDLYTTRTALLAGLQAYIFGAYVSVGSAFYNFAADNSFYTNFQRFSAGDVNPDGFGFSVALGIPVAWYLALSNSTTRMSHLLKLVNYAYLPTAFLGIALSGTRTALIAAVPGMVFGLASLTRRRLSAQVMIFLLLTSAVFLLLPLVQPLKSFQRLSTTGTELTEGDLNNRTNNWQEGLAAFAEHPLTGVGSNMYRSVNRWEKVAHNSFLSVLVELGLIGFALFGMILIMVIIQALRQPKWESRFWLTVLLVWAIGASTLTWEYRKTTWVFLGLIVVSAALTNHRDEAVPLAKPGTSVSPLVRQAK